MNKLSKDFRLLDWYTVAYVTIILVSNIVAQKVIQIGWFSNDAGLFLFPLSYIFGDVITEVYGYEADRKRIWMGFFANLLMVFSFLYVIILPFNPEIWTNQEAFSTILGNVPRVVIGSMAAYWFGSFANSFIMSKMKIWMRTFDKTDKFLFVRTIGSTVVGELIDSFLFVHIVFLFVIPYSEVLKMVLFQYVGKTLLEILFTPLTYWIIAKTKKIEGIDITGADTYNPMKM